MEKEKSKLLLIGKLLCISLCVSSINTSYAAALQTDKEAKILSNCPEKSAGSEDCKVTRLKDGDFHSTDGQQYCLYRISCTPYMIHNKRLVQTQERICVTALIKPEDTITYKFDSGYRRTATLTHEPYIKQQDICIDGHTSMTGNYCGWVNHDDQLHPYHTHAEKPSATIELEHANAGWTCPAGA